MKLVKKLTPMYLLVTVISLSLALLADRTVTAFSNAPMRSPGRIFVIDAGHGGVDGGATSCSGVLESELNLQIALRLDDLMHLLGLKTVMIRTTDVSVYTSGNTIAAKKVSDLKQRVKIVNETLNAVLISIHQNMFSDAKYSGAQVFYAHDEESKAIGEKMQQNLIRYLNPGSQRKSKKADSVYLMEHIERPGILVECGFLSNMEEEAKLRSVAYQQKLCGVIAATLSSHFQGGNKLP